MQLALGVESSKTVATHTTAACCEHPRYNNPLGLEAVDFSVYSSSLRLDRQPIRKNTAVRFGFRENSIGGALSFHCSLEAEQAAAMTGDTGLYMIIMEICKTSLAADFHPDHRRTRNRHRAAGNCAASSPRKTAASSPPRVTSGLPRMPTTLLPLCPRCATHPSKRKSFPNAASPSPQKEWREEDADPIYNAPWRICNTRARPGATVPRSANSSRVSTTSNYFARDRRLRQCRHRTRNARPSSHLNWLRKRRERARTAGLHHPMGCSWRSTPHTLYRLVTEASVYKMLEKNKRDTLGHACAPCTHVRREKSPQLCKQKERNAIAMDVAKDRASCGSEGYPTPHAGLRPALPLSACPFAAGTQEHQQCDLLGQRVTNVVTSEDESARKKRRTCYTTRETERNANAHLCSRARLRVLGGHLFVYVKVNKCREQWKRSDDGVDVESKQKPSCTHRSHEPGGHSATLTSSPQCISPGDESKHNALGSHDQGIHQERTRTCGASAAARAHASKRTQARKSRVEREHANPDRGIWKKRDALGNISWKEPNILEGLSVNQDQKKERAGNQWKWDGMESQPPPIKGNEGRTMSRQRRKRVHAGHGRRGKQRAVPDEGHALQLGAEAHNEARNAQEEGSWNKRAQKKTKVARFRESHRRPARESIDREGRHVSIQRGGPSGDGGWRKRDDRQDPGDETCASNHSRLNMIINSGLEPTIVLKEDKDMLSISTI
ncbi:hypothetical protein B0H16DRAFT_1769632 [Mycena metata]|uniref:Uncharacterized protein n=1 Tax=Mycena metata TaxID=1033252 RepID=A0AAD7MU64_9AGAR|nr:hypothetical protein B0H16DRAFT_1769632 [Mycena metata]